MPLCQPQYTHELVFDTEPAGNPGKKPSRQFAPRHPKIKYCVEYLRLTALLDEIMPWVVYHLGNKTGRRIDLLRMHGHGRRSDNPVKAKNPSASVQRGPHASRASKASWASAIVLACSAAAVRGKSFTLIEGLSMITGFDGSQSEAEANTLLVQITLAQGVLDGKSNYFKKTRAMVEGVHQTAKLKEQ